MTNIVPTKRLLVWFALICFPFTLLGAAVDSGQILPYGIIAVFCLLVFVDAGLSIPAFRRVQVKFPEIVRLSKGRNGEIQFSIHHDPITSLRVFRVGIGFPKELQTLDQDQIVEIPKGRQAASCTWKIRPGRQGKYPLKKCYVARKSPLGFWSRRKMFTLNCEARVFPDLIAQKTILGGLLLNKNLGIHAQRQIGKGREFEQLRNYIPGDGLEDIHWKATAKKGFPISKVYQIEKTQDIYLILDTSRLSGRNAAIYNRLSTVERRYSEDEKKKIDPDTILEKFIVAALTTGMVAERQGDNSGILTFSDRVTGFIKAKRGKTHYNACRDLLYTTTAQKVSPDYSELFTFIGNKIRKRAFLIFLTSLDDPVLAEYFLQHVSMINRRHLISINMMKPAMANPVFSNKKVNSIHHLYQDVSGHFLWAGLKETEKILYRSGALFCMLDHKEVSPQLVTQYLNIKKRQLL